MQANQEDAGSSKPPQPKSVGKLVWYGGKVARRRWESCAHERPVKSIKFDTVPADGQPTWGSKAVIKLGPPPTPASTTAPILGRRAGSAFGIGEEFVCVAPNQLFPRIAFRVENITRKGDYWVSYLEEERRGPRQGPATSTTQ